MMCDDDVILLVEDNPDDVELTRRAFEKCHILNKIVVASDGQEALDYLLAQGSYAVKDAALTPRVVLLDLNLPKVSGLDVLRRLRGDERTRRLPIVILTTSLEDRDVVDSYNLGASSYVRKPVDFAQFLEAAKQIGQYWLALNEPPPMIGAKP
jgi:two-component system, response regulator